MSIIPETLCYQFQKIVLLNCGHIPQLLKIKMNIYNPPKLLGSIQVHYLLLLEVQALSTLNSLYFLQEAVKD